MPNMAKRPMQREQMTHPTAMVKPCPLTDERICPAIMEAMIPQPTLRITLRAVGSFAGQYPKKYRPRICETALHQ